jgi:aminoglycoside phosphotransferase (APT) family kinase protein
MEIARGDGQRETLVLRCHGEDDRLRNPSVTEDEYRLLQQLKGAGVAVPDAYLLDTSGEILPAPYLLLEHIDGETVSQPPNLDDFAYQLALHLVRIHQVDWVRLGLDFLPEKAGEVTRKLANPRATLDTALSEERIRAALEALWPFPQHNPSVLLHGDFWSGNTLWNEGRLVAVIDWENAVLGDPLADVANGRLELLWAFGTEAMQGFTDYYRAMLPLDVTNLPHWDLVAALRPAHNLLTWGLEPTIEQRMLEAHRWFVARALEALEEG